MALCGRSPTRGSSNRRPTPPCSAGESILLGQNGGAYSEKSPLLIHTRHGLGPQLRLLAPNGFGRSFRRQLPAPCQPHLVTCHRPAHERHRPSWLQQQRALLGVGVAHHEPARGQSLDRVRERAHR